MLEIREFVKSVERELINETTIDIAKRIEGSELLDLLEKRCQNQLNQ